MNKSKALFAISSIFVFLCLLHYFSQRPLWNDEEAIYENIRNSSYSQLFSELRSIQAFPRIHLIVIKHISGLFHDSLLALRFLSLVFMLGAFFAWMKLYKIHLDLKDNSQLILLLALSFACSYRLTYYAAELKPYSMDVLAVAVYALFLDYQKRSMTKLPTAKLYAGAALLPLCMFFSYTSVFVCWMVAYNFLLMMRDNKALLKPLLLNVGVLFISFLICYNVDLKYSANVQGLHDYWQGSFLSLNSAEAFFGPLTEGLKKIVVFWHGPSKAWTKPALFFIPFFIYSVFAFGLSGFRQGKGKIFSIDALGFVLLLEMIVLGILHKYPFTGERITLFFAPFCFYFILKGINAVPDRNIRNALLVYYAGYCCACLINTFVIYLRLYS